VYPPNAVVYHSIEPNRLNKFYFQTWFYNDGRSGIRVNPWPYDAICYFGIPHWMYRDLAVNFVQWMISFGPKHRFHHKLRTYRGIGGITEARRLIRSGGELGCRNPLQTRAAKTNRQRAISWRIRMKAMLLNRNAVNVQPDCENAAQKAI
jgi:hypothetical protein